MLLTTAALNRLLNRQQTRATLEKKSASLFALHKTPCYLTSTGKACSRYLDRLIIFSLFRAKGSKAKKKNLFWDLAWSLFPSVQGNVSFPSSLWCGWYGWLGSNKLYSPQSQEPLHQYEVWLESPQTAQLQSCHGSDNILLHQGYSSASWGSRGRVVLGALAHHPLRGLLMNLSRYQGTAVSILMGSLIDSWIIWDIQAKESKAFRGRTVSE